MIPYELNLVSTGFTDKVAVADAFGRAAETYDTAARLQRLVAEELLGWLRAGMSPENCARVLDVGCGTGQLLRLLKPSEGSELLCGFDLAMGMLRHSRTVSGLAHVDWIQGDAEHWPFAAETFDVILSNFALQWCDQPERVLAGIAGSLAGDGRCLLALPVEGTLRELAESWRVADPHSDHVSQFIAAPRLAAMAKDAGLVLGRSCLIRQTVLYHDVGSLARELKALGAHNGARQRRRHLTGRHTFGAMVRHYEGFRRPDGKLPATWCVFLGEFRRAVR